MSEIETLDKWLTAAPSIQNLKYELKKLQTIREWAIERIDIDYRVGDSVTLIKDPGITEEHKPGWWIYRECLVVGARATIRELDFSGGRWRADFVLEREWSVSDWGTEMHRHWNGPVALMPDDDPTMKPGRDYPGVFCLDADAFAKADTIPLAAEPVRKRAGK